MIEAVGTVLRCEGGRVTLTWQSQSACGHCEQGDQCGTGVVAKALTPKSNILTLPCGRDYPQGTQLRLGIAESDLLSASALVYLFPLAGLLAGAILGQQLAGSEGGSIALALLGGVGGFGVARFRARQQRQRITILGELGQPVANA
ncbi:SoxR reducing system RseC family protein [Ferrimonas balearica]|uniref:SoxR reducing system RseC family protein n=1 Tax=Ferrimonas balearica TaxID=44012 RepID=UPI001C9A09DC|nr:SoxR reducing system RseC family protein [Ferrimonas balearica]MBY5993489.1 SoxR reducing system RseC family protein [Ferrimonas balearica]